MLSFLFENKKTTHPCRQVSHLRDPLVEIQDEGAYLLIPLRRPWWFVSMKKNNQKLNGFLKGKTNQWLFLVPVKGGRWNTSPNWQYIPLIYHLYIALWGLYATYHPLREPETTIELRSELIVELLDVAGVVVLGRSVKVTRVKTSRNTWTDMDQRHDFWHDWHVSTRATKEEDLPWIT